MQSPKLAKAKPGPSTVRFLDIAEIRDDTVVLKDGTLRAVVLVSSINFALKSEDEQEAIITAYVSFLNSLEHSIEVVIQSRKLNIDAYMSQLVQKEREQTNQQSWIERIVIGKELGAIEMRSPVTVEIASIHVTKNVRGEQLECA